jgi:hypothetical protein
MHTIAILSTTRASILGHLFFQKGVLVLPLVLEPLSVRRNAAEAGVRGVSSRSSSLLSSRASSGVCSVVRLDLCDGVDRVERVDLLEAGRELGVREEPHCASCDSMADGMIRIVSNQALRFSCVAGC